MSSPSSAGVKTIEPAKLSHWFNQMYGEDGVAVRPSLIADVDADVCIVGAGYTGLWTAYYLLRQSPDLRVVLLDAEIAGYGASGRNGGAVIAQFNGSRSYWMKKGGRDGLLALERAVRKSVDDVGVAVERESIDCKYAKNGVVMVARNELELERFRESVDEDRVFGIGPEGSELLDREQILSRVRVEGAIGARLNHDCASIHAGELVRGLADTVERLGATIYEKSRVSTIEPGKAITAYGQVRAKYVVRATEAYTESIEARRIVPVHTTMLVTDVVPGHVWDEIGWTGREALLAEHPFLHLQHTADHRITIGGDDNRVPYLFKSKPSPDEPGEPKVVAMYHNELVRLFPALRAVDIAGSWQGVFGASRSWAPAVGLDASTGLAFAGGYVGEGVAMSNLAGQVLADLLRGVTSDLTKLPLVGPEPRKWEPEPLRTVGAAAIYQMRSLGDRKELRTGKPSRLLEIGNKLAGYQGHIG
jgi:glycine/D-amino acid oxidase-like deaminating enzyme